MKVIFPMLLTLLALPIAACDPNAKVVRSEQEDPRGAEGNKENGSKDEKNEKDDTDEKSADQGKDEDEVPSSKNPVSTPTAAPKARGNYARKGQNSDLVSPELAGDGSVV